MVSLLLLALVILLGIAAVVPSRRPLHARERWFLWSTPLPCLLMVVVPSAWNASHGWQRSGPGLERASLVGSLALGAVLIATGVRLQWTRERVGVDARIMAGMVIAGLPWLMIGLLYLEFAVLS